MSQEFYLTLPSNSSLDEFANNSNSSFKVRLPKPMRLEGGGWKVALSNLSIPDPNNKLPDWLDNDTPLIYTSWYHHVRGDTSKRRFLEASFLLRDIDAHVDVEMMSGHDFMRSLVNYLEKKQLENNLEPDWMIASASVIITSILWSATTRSCSTVLRWLFIILVVKIENYLNRSVICHPPFLFTNDWL